MLGPRRRAMLIRRIKISIILDILGWPGTIDTASSQPADCEALMTNIQIFEPGLCCGTGICGVDVDQQLVTVSADIDWATSAGGSVRRYRPSLLSLDTAGDLAASDAGCCGGASGSCC